MADVYVQDAKQANEKVQGRTLYKGDLVVFVGGNSGVVMAVPETRQLYVADMGSVSTGNHYGAPFKRGTTVAQYNESHWSKIAKVYDTHDYGILFEIKN